MQNCDDFLTKQKTKKKRKCENVKMWKTRSTINDYENVRGLIIIYAHA